MTINIHHIQYATPRTRFDMSSPHDVPPPHVPHALVGITCQVHNDPPTSSALMPEQRWHDDNAVHVANAAVLLPPTTQWHYDNDRVMVTATTHGQ